MDGLIEGVGRLQGRNNTLSLGHLEERLKGLCVSDSYVSGTERVLEECVFWAYTGVVQACRDGLGLGDLSSIILSTTKKLKNELKYVIKSG